jgi:rod shape-determining protein MreC
MKINKFVLIIIVFLLLISINKFFLDTTKNSFYNITSPIQSFFWGIGDSSSNFLQSFLEGKNLKRDNQEILKQNQKLLVDIQEIRSLKKENQELKQVLGFELDKEFELILVESMSKETGGDFILVSGGTENGVLKGMPVITKEKIVVGTIDKTYKDFSRVLLISNKESNFDVEIQKKDSIEKVDEIYGLAQGKGNLKINLELVPQEKDITEGDIVFTTILAGVFPKGLLVGEVKNIRNSDISAFQEAEIEPYFKNNLSGILFVIKSFIPKEEL